MKYWMSQLILLIMPDQEQQSAIKTTIKNKGQNVYLVAFPQQNKHVTYNQFVTKV